jgi:protein-tyrosine phosphatase
VAIEAIMDWITDQIAIGNYIDALDLELIRNSGFASALSLDGTLHGKAPSQFGLDRIEVVMLEDAPGNESRLFLRAVEYLETLIEESPPVLVQCHAGRSRSAVVVAGYLMKAHGLTSDAALAQVAAKRSIAVTAGVERLLDYL